LFKAFINPGTARFAVSLKPPSAVIVFISSTVLLDSSAIIKSGIVINESRSLSE
jgi:hypothetical protein